MKKKTQYQTNPNGLLRRLGPPKLNKADKKMLKRIKREARRDPVAFTALGRPVSPHRSGGAQAANLVRKVKSTIAKAMQQQFEPQTPVPVRCLTPEAREERWDFEQKYLNYGGCSCHINPPCSYCTHPGNPLNQEDDSCWTEVIPPVVSGEDWAGLAHGTSPFVGMVLKGCVDCPHNSRCVGNEAVLHHYIGCSPEELKPMTPEQRDWCLDEIGAVEGHTRTEAIDLPDAQLAEAVLHAWADYARDKGAM